VGCQERQLLKERRAHSKSRRQEPSAKERKSASLSLNKEGKRARRDTQRASEKKKRNRHVARRKTLRVKGSIVDVEKEGGKLHKKPKKSETRPPSKRRRETMCSEIRDVPSAVGKASSLSEEARRWVCTGLQRNRMRGKKTPLPRHIAP